MALSFLSAYVSPYNSIDLDFILDGIPPAFCYSVSSGFILVDVFYKCSIPLDLGSNSFLHYGVSESEEEEKKAGGGVIIMGLEMSRDSSDDLDADLYAAAEGRPIPRTRRPPLPGEQRGCHA